MPSLKQKHKQAMAKKRETTIRALQQFVSSVNWNEWWEEFFTAKNPNGTFVYVTSWDFAKKKGRNPAEQKAIYWCIGPKPTRTDETGKEVGMPVKWLGNWDEQRATTLYYADKKIQALKKVLTERADGLEAARGVATVALDWMAKVDRWSQQISQAFQDALVVPGDKVDKNFSRARQFLQLQEQCQEMQTKAVGLFLRCQGLNVDDVSALAQMAAVGAKAALSGVETASNITQKEQVLKTLMSTFVEKSRIWGLSLPGTEEPSRTIIVDKAADGAEHTEEQVVEVSEDGELVAVE